MSLKEIIFTNIIKFFIMFLLIYLFVEDKNIMKSLVFSFVMALFSFVIDLKNYNKKWNVNIKITL